MTETHSCCSACKTGWIPVSLWHYGIRHAPSFTFLAADTGWYLEGLHCLSLHPLKHNWASRFKHLKLRVAIMRVVHCKLDLIPLWTQNSCPYRNICLIITGTHCAAFSPWDGWYLHNKQSSCILFLWWNTLLPAHMFSSKPALALLMISFTVFLTVRWISLSCLPAFSEAGVTLKWETE